MKYLLAIAVALTSFSMTPLRAEDGKVRAAVVAQSANAELRATGSAKGAGRRVMEVGEVYEIGATNGRFEELKIDAEHVALVPTSALRICECTADELSQAQTKFNVLSHDNQRTAQKNLSNSNKSTQGGFGVNPMQMGINKAAANKARREQAKELKTSSAALVKESLAWAAAHVVAPAAPAK